MPTHQLLQGLGRACRAAANTFWRFSRRVPQHGISVGSSRAARPYTTAHARQARRPATIALSGSEILDLFEELRAAVQAIRRLQTSIQECNEEIGDEQQVQDVTYTGLARIGPALRLQHAAFVATLEDSRAEAVARKSELRGMRDQLDKDLTDSKSRATMCLQTFYAKSQEYFNKCLSVDFRETWSLAEKYCAGLRLLLDVAELNNRAMGELRRAKYNLAIARIAQRRATKQINEVAQTLPDALSQHLDSIREARYAKEVEDLQGEIKFVQDEIQQRTALIERMQGGAVDEFIGPLLDDAGRFEMPDEENGERSVGSMPPDDHTSDVEDIRSEGYILLQAFQEASRTLEDLQKQFTLRQYEMRDESAQVFHVTTFSNTTPALLEAHAVARQERLEQELQSAEQNFDSARDKLLASGAQIPLDHSGQSSRGNRRSNDTAKIRGIRRQPMNDWRFRAKGAASTSRVTKRSSSSLSRLESGVCRSPSTSISPLRKQKLDEYKKEQARLRGEV